MKATTPSAATLIAQIAISQATRFHHGPGPRCAFINDSLRRTSRRILATLTVSLGLFALYGLEKKSGYTHSCILHRLGRRPLRGGLFLDHHLWRDWYSDAAMAEEWRLASAIEGINGIILIGWSTAFFVT